MAEENKTTTEEITNQQPDNTEPKVEESNEPTLEELKVQLAQEKARNARWKTDYDKLCSSEGNLRKQLKAKQTAEEQEAEAKAEAARQQEEYVKGLKRRCDISDATETYLGMGMDKDLAKATATADVDGDKDTVMVNIKKYQEAWKKEQEASIRQQYLDRMPEPSSGNDTSVDFTKIKADAIASGDDLALAAAIRNEYQATHRA